jgi:hypothetical protein
MRTTFGQVVHFGVFTDVAWAKPRKVKVHVFARVFKSV